MPLRRIRIPYRSAVPAAALAAALAFGSEGAQAAVASGGGWAGYVAASSTYTSVTATWVEPAVTCGSAQASLSFWVGLDGFSDSTVEQIGTEVACVGGRQDHIAWYEMYPAAPVDLPNAVAPGDSLTATVSATAKDVFTLTIEDNTAGWSNSSQHTETGALRHSAEVVLEPPTTVAAPVAGSITFTAAKVDGAALGAANPTRIGSGSATCGPLVGGTQFTCTW